MIERVKAEPRDIADMMEGLRKADREDIWNLLARPVNNVLWENYEICRDRGEIWGARINGVCEALWGVAPMLDLSYVGVPFVLGSEKGAKLKVIWGIESKRCVKRWNEQYPVLCQWVSAAPNRVHVRRWLTWLGFRLRASAPFGAFGLPHHQADMGIKE